MVESRLDAIKVLVVGQRSRIDARRILLSSSKSEFVSNCMAPELKPSQTPKDPTKAGPTGHAFEIILPNLISTL